MNREAVVAQFGEETLANHNFFVRDHAEPWEVGIMGAAPHIIVYRTDERNLRVLDRAFSSESDALDTFARKLDFELRRRARTGNQRPW